MIARLVAWFRESRIQHYHRKASAAGAATLAAQQRRDWSTAAGAMRDMHAAQAKRDALIDKRPRSAVYQCRCCHTNYFRAQPCDWCPTSWSVRPLPSGDFEVARP